MSHSADFKDNVCKKNSKEWTTYPFQEFREIAVRKKNGFKCILHKTGQQYVIFRSSIGAVV